MQVYFFSHINQFQVPTHAYCGDGKPRVSVLPSSFQLWIRFFSRDNYLNNQSVDFHYSLQSLGVGRLFTDDFGIIEGNGFQLSRRNLTSVWLIRLKSSQGMDLKLQNVRLPKRHSRPVLLIRNGLFKTSPLLLRLNGVVPTRLVKLLGRELRIEFHPNLKNKHPARAAASDGFTISYSAWKAENESSNKGLLR